MVRVRRLAWLLPLALMAAPAAARGPVQEPILEPPPLPRLTARCAEVHQGFLVQNMHRAVAFGAAGRACGSAYNYASQAEADARALATCAKQADDCRIYARGLDVVGRPATRPPPPAPFGDGDWQARPDPSFLSFGPSAAAGAVLHAHGLTRGKDLREAKVFPLARRFNLVGWDVWRFDRAPEPDRDYAWALARHRDAARGLRRLGYARVVAMGQSRGAWTALGLLAEPGLVDGVVAAAPARHGATAGSEVGVGLRQMRDWTQTLAGIAPARTRVALMHFAEDPYDADPASRAARAAERLAAAGLPHLVLAAPAGFSGHTVASSWRFNKAYGACILAFVTGGEPGRAACPEPE